MKFTSAIAAILVCVAAHSQALRDSVAASASDAKPLPVGATVPDSTVQGLDGKSMSLRTILGGRRTVLIFYRGGWCPFCNAHLADLQTIEAEVIKRGYHIIAISPDTPSELKKTLDRHQLTYRLFSDSSGETMKRFGVAFRLDDATFDMYRTRYHIDIERASGQTHHILPVPSVFVVSKRGKILFVHSNPDYKVRMKGSDILKVIDANR